MFLSERPYTFEYDHEGNIVGYNCGCYAQHNQFCEETSELMIEWATSLNRPMAVRVGKRNEMLGEDAPIQILATRT